MTDADWLYIEPEDRYLVAALSKIRQKYDGSDSTSPGSTGTRKNTSVICHAYWSMPSRKLALVTGANRGIGFEIVRQLSKHDFRVVLAARNRNAGERAVSKLNRNVSFQTLDVS